MDQWIINSAKIKYKTRVVRQYLHQMERGSNPSCYESLLNTVLDAIQMLTVVWESVTLTLNGNCFLKVNFRSNEDIIRKESISHPDVKEDWLNAQETVGGDFIDLDTFINIVKDLVTSKVRSLDDIILDVTLADKTDEEEGEDELYLGPHLHSPKLRKCSVLSDSVHPHWTRGPR